MTRVASIRYELVNTIPRQLEDGVLYISRKYRTAAHKCCCGCGNEVVTPLGQTDWNVRIVGDAVSVYPSIGNWSLACKSHYWIDHGTVRWVAQWTAAQIRYGRERDRLAKQRHYGDQGEPGIWVRLWRWLTGRSRDD